MMALAQHHRSQADSNSSNLRLAGEDLPDTQAVRLELICRIRSMIDSGAYDTDDRLQTALDRLLDEMM